MVFQLQNVQMHLMTSITMKTIFIIKKVIRKDTLENHLHCLAVLRNKCAHAARMYNTDFNPPAKFTTSFLRKHPEIKNNFDGEGSDFYYAYAFVPDGVVCLLSAAVYYNLSTYRPDAIDVAIPRKARVSTLPDWPELNVCYFTDDRFDVGIETVEDGNNRFRIYDIEKTVVDIVFYREKIGIEETKEVLTTYLHRSDRNLNKLIRYAQMLKCGEVMKRYLEVLV